MNQVLKNIKEIIKKHGFFRYNVLQETTPRYSYTIGLTKSIGFELILGGMMYFESDEEIELIFNTISEELIKNNQARKFNINGLGFFKLVEVDISWVTKTMLGAIDFYKIENIEAFQIVTLDSEKITLDTPDMSKKWSSKNTIWKYLEQDEPWQFKIPKNSIAITNLAALKGNRLTEIFRYEIDEWEIFSGNGAVEPKESIRIVPIIILLGLDKTIEEFIDEPIGKGRFRDSSDENNPIWYNWE